MAGGGQPLGFPRTLFYLRLTSVSPRSHPRVYGDTSAAGGIIIRAGGGDDSCVSTCQWVFFLSLSLFLLHGGRKKARRPLFEMRERCVSVFFYFFRRRWWSKYRSSKIKKELLFRRKNCFENSQKKAFGKNPVEGSLGKNRKKNFLPFLPFWYFN